MQKLEFFKQKKNVCTFLEKCCNIATLGLVGSRISVFVLALCEQFRTTKGSFAGLIAYLAP